MSNKENNKTTCLDFSVESIVLLLWNKKWAIVVVTLLFIGLGVVLFQITKEPQFYKYTTELTLKYQLDTGENQNSWVTCEQIPWKMVKVDYSQVLSDSAFLKKLVVEGALGNSDSFFPIVIESYDSLRIVLALSVLGKSDSAVKLLQKVGELFPSYVSGLQKEKLDLEIFLLDKRKEQIISELTDKGQRLQDLLNKKSTTVIDRMEVLRLENECKVLYNLSLDLTTQISSLQIFLKDKDLLVLKPADKIEIEKIPGGLFSHLSMFVLLFAFLGFMVVVNLIIIKAYLIDRCR